MNTKTQITKAFGALVIGVTFLSAAQASQPVVDNALTAKVQFADLNLDSNAGAKILYSRLREAARDVCSPLLGQDLASKARWNKCYEGAIAAAVVKINSAALTQMAKN
jgi:UrcA family protein